jgi:putative ABC transport system permease protein
MRTFTTIFGVALALSFFLSVVIMADSMLIFMDKAKDANNWDYEISIAGFVPVSTREIWLEERDVIDRVDYTIRLPMNVSKDGSNKEMLLVGNSDLSNTFNVGIDFNEESGIYISQFIADEFHIGKGDWVDVELPVLQGINNFEMKYMEMEVLGVHTNPMGLFIYADISYVYQVTHLDDLANVFYLDSIDGQLPGEVRNTIASTPGVSSVTYVSQQNQNLDEAFELMMSMIFMMILIAFVLMLAIVYNITMINASEKSREYATMKTLGTSIKRISYLIFIEGAVTIIGGTFLGSIGGYYLAIAMLQGTELLEGFAFDVIFSVQWFLVGASLVAFVVLIVAILTIRYINNIIIADVIRERSAG